MAITRRSFLAGLGSVSVGLLFHRQLDRVLDSLERDLVEEPVVAAQLPAAIDIVVQPQAAFRPERLMIAGILIGKETVAETVWQPCPVCDGDGSDWNAVLCTACDGSDWNAVLCTACDGTGGTHVETGKLVEREVCSVPWIIENITIGDHAQLTGEVPGDLFSSASPDVCLAMDTAAPGASIRFRVRYVGDDPAGARFRGAVIGTSVGPDGLPRRSLLPIDSGVAIAA